MQLPGCVTFSRNTLLEVSIDAVSLQAARQTAQPDEGPNLRLPLKSRPQRPCLLCDITSSKFQKERVTYFLCPCLGLFSAGARDNTAALTVPVSIDDLTPESDASAHPGNITLD